MLRRQAVFHQLEEVVSSAKRRFLKVWGLVGSQAGLRFYGPFALWILRFPSFLEVRVKPLLWTLLLAMRYPVA